MPDMTRRLASLLRHGEWFSPKLPPVFMIAYSLLLTEETGGSKGLLPLASLLVSISCLGAFGYAVNDVSDVASDARANRQNPMLKLASGARAAICLVLFCSGFVPLLWLHSHWISTVILLTNYALAAAYSLPPIRLKERGLLGVLADALAVHALPSLFAASFFSSLGTPQVGSAVLWWFLAGLRGILLHQIWDRENDEKSGVRTLATVHGVTRIADWLRFAVFPAEVLAFGHFLLTLVPRIPVLTVVALYAIGDIFKKKIWGVSLDPAPVVKGTYVVPAGLYQAWLPLALVTLLAVEFPAFRYVAAAHVLVFRREIWLRFREAGNLVRDGVLTSNAWARSRRRPRRLVFAIAAVAIGFLIVEGLLQAGAFVFWWRYRRPDPLSYSGTVVLCVGDSYTFGVGASSSAGSYPELLAAFLRARSGRPWTVINAGYPDQNSREVLSAIPEQLRRYRPEFVCILTGGNDSWSRPKLLNLAKSEPGSSFEERFQWKWRTGLLLAIASQRLEYMRAPAFCGEWHAGETPLVISPESDQSLVLEEHLRRIVAACRAARAEPVLLTYPFEKLELDQSIRKVAVSEKTALADTWPTISKALQTSRREDLFVPDGHCTDKGYEVMASIVAEEMLQRGRPR